MKILIATYTYYPAANGAAYFAYRLAGELAKQGHEVSVMCPSRSFRNTIHKENGVTVYGVRSIYFPVQKNFRLSFVILSRKTMRRMIEKIAPDVVHTQNSFMISKGAAAIAKKMGIPVVGTNHFMPENIVKYFYLPAILENLLGKATWRQTISILEKMDEVTTPTEAAAKLLINAGFKKNVEVISNGIDLNKFSPTGDASYLKDRYGIPKDVPVLLYLGRLDKEKGMDVILRAMPEIIKRTPAHLVIAGTGNEKEKLERMAESSGIQKSVTFTGFVPEENMTNIYKIADAFVISSTVELQSIVTMEAMASGLPIIAADAVALPELVRDGENGFLFPPGDSSALVEKAIQLLSDEILRKKMAERSLEMIQTHDIGNTVSKFETVYKKTIKRLKE